MSVSTHLHLALEIQRRYKPREWADAIERLPEAAREECRVYLRGMYQRARIVAQLQDAAPDEYRTRRR